MSDTADIQRPPQELIDARGDISSGVFGDRVLTFFKGRGGICASTIRSVMRDGSNTRSGAKTRKSLSRYKRGRCRMNVRRQSSCR
jgi:hypothetical protein